MEELTRKERERAARRNEILKTSLAIFAKKGFHGTTMAEISRESQYPLGTIYRFFSGKEQIYHDMMMEKCRELGRNLRGVFERKDWRPVRRLMATLRASAEFYAGNRAFVMLFISQRSQVNAALDPEISRNISRMHEKLIEMYTELFQEGMDKKEFKRFSSREVAIHFTGVLHSTTWFWLTESKPESSLEKKLDGACAIFLQGICTEKEHSL